MKLPLLIISAFALIVVIIPLSIVTSNGVYRPVENSSSATLPFEENVTVPIPAQNISTQESTQESEASEAQDDITEAVQSDNIEDTSTLAQIYYTNSFNIHNASTNKIENVSAFDYVMGAVAAEMPASFSLEALKAQAVASYTYALRVRYDNIKSTVSTTPEGADFSCDPDNLKGYITEETAKEFYGDKFDLYWGKVEEAVSSVFEEVLVYNGQPIVAAYHASSSGITEAASNVWSGSADYLVPVQSEGDILSPGYESEVSFSASELKRLLESKWPEIYFGEIMDEWIIIVDVSESGYVMLADVGGVMLSGADIREALGLRSAAFDIRSVGEELLFTVRGYGHGVGLSQYGADYMARQGSDYKDILMHYYPGAEFIMAR